MTDLVLFLTYGDSTTVSVISNSTQQVSFSVPIETQVIYICVVYASTSYLLRRRLWNDINELQNTYPGPWCLIGDFNAVLGSHEVRGSAFPSRQSYDDFIAFTDIGSWTHIMTRGAEYT